MNKSQKKYIIGHHLARIISKLEDLSDEQLDKYLRLFEQADPRYFMWDQDKLQPKTKTESKK